MYRQISHKITKWLMLKKIIAYEEKEIYQYSVEVLVSDIFYILIALLTAIATCSFIASMSFFAGFLLLRKFSGGYHASTYWRCHFLFWVNQVIMISLYYLVPIRYSLILSLFFILVSIVCVFVLAPVGNENKPLSNKEKRKFAFLSRMIIIFDAAVVIGLSIINAHLQYICMYAFGVFSVSISLVAEKMKYFRKRGDH